MTTANTLTDETRTPDSVFADGDTIRRVSTGEVATIEDDEPKARLMMTVYVNSGDDAGHVREALKRLKAGGSAMRPYNQTFRGIESLDWDQDFEVVEDEQ